MADYSPSDTLDRPNLLYLRAAKTQKPGIFASFSGAKTQPLCITLFVTLRI